MVTGRQPSGGGQRRGRLQAGADRLCQSKGYIGRQSSTRIGEKCSPKVYLPAKTRAGTEDRKLRHRRSADSHDQVGPVFEKIMPNKCEPGRRLEEKSQRIQRENSNTYTGKIALLVYVCIPRAVLNPCINQRIVRMSMPACSRRLSLPVNRSPLFHHFRTDLVSAMQRVWSLFPALNAPPALLTSGWRGSRKNSPPTPGHPERPSAPFR